MPIFQAILRLLYPKRCFSCRTFNTDYCLDCLFSTPKPIESDFFALYPYIGKPKQAIKNLKYKRKSEAAKALIEHRRDDVAIWLSEKLQSFEDQKMYMVPIPQHYTRSFERGFNQSEFIIKALGYIPHKILKKLRSTDRQASLSRQSRLKNIIGTIVSKKKLDPHACYIIIDDVRTTGATAKEAETALRLAGAQNVLSIFFAV